MSAHSVRVSRRLRERRDCGAVVVATGRMCHRTATRRFVWNADAPDEHVYDLCRQHAEMFEYNAIHARAPFRNVPLEMAPGAAEP